MNVTCGGTMRASTESVWYLGVDLDQSLDGIDNLLARVCVFGLIYLWTSSGFPLHCTPEWALPPQTLHRSVGSYSPGIYLENLEFGTKKSMHGKIMEFQKWTFLWKNHGILFQLSVFFFNFRIYFAEFILCVTCVSFLAWYLTTGGYMCPDLLT